jgi:hypothetical protein
MTVSGSVWLLCICKSYSYNLVNEYFYFKYPDHRINFLFGDNNLVMYKDGVTQNITEFHTPEQKLGEINSCVKKAQEHYALEILNK